MITIGTQYYRPPFPESRYWQEDLRLMKASGLNAVQLWVVWAWVESEPDVFRFDDYDRILDLAEAEGLGVVLSTIAAVHPYWIHSVVPGSEMITSDGRTVISSNRVECHHGLTPGGCLDHPGVWPRMSRFIATVVQRYRDRPHLLGWDAWNELRWNIQADGFVCYCPHTIKAFRDWLDGKYGGIDGLNKSWHRRYNSFSEVHPGVVPTRPYTEMMAFEHFLTQRADQHARVRYDLIKGLDPSRPVTVHGARPTPLHPGSMEAHDMALNRGNDWSFAEHVDGVGFSSFPKWYGQDASDFAVRVQFGRSAAGDKALWLSELQGGRGNKAFTLSEPVDAASQQSWLWNGLAAGADTILFWCWRDEVFGQESSGYGITGTDGYAEERLAGFRETARILEKNGAVLDGYRQDCGAVAVLFSPQSYYLYWAQEGTAGKVADSLEGYCKALTRRSIPYTVVEEEHLDTLDRYRVLFAPRVVVTSAAGEAALERWVKNGGTLVCESEFGAFDPTGVYSYPEDRFVARVAGIRELGRRLLGKDFVSVMTGSSQWHLTPEQWLTPMDGGTALAASDLGPLVVEQSVGQGRIVVCGSYFGRTYRAEPCQDFESFLQWLVERAGVELPWKTPAVGAAGLRPHLISGRSRTGRVAFAFYQAEEAMDLMFRPGFWSGNRLTNVITGEAVSLQDTGQGQRCSVRGTARVPLAVLVEQ